MDCCHCSLNFCLEIHRNCFYCFFDFDFLKSAKILVKLLLGLWTPSTGKPHLLEILWRPRFTCLFMRPWSLAIKIIHHLIFVMVLFVLRIRSKPLFPFSSIIVAFLQSFQTKISLMVFWENSRYDVLVSFQPNGQNLIWDRKEKQWVLQEISNLDKMFFGKRQNINRVFVPLIIRNDLKNLEMYCRFSIKPRI